MESASASSGLIDSYSDDQSSKCVSLASTTFREPYAKILRQIGAWFRLVENMRGKYGIQDCDFYNFDETGFMMGMI